MVNQYHYRFFDTVVGKSIKLNYAFPTQFAVSADLFSNTLTKFDNTNLTFDDDYTIISL